MPRIMRIPPELESKLKAEFPIYEFKLINNKYRFRKGKYGYCSEKLKKGLSSDKWIPVSTYRGSDDIYYFSSLESCYYAFVNKIIEEINLSGSWL